MSLKIGNCVRLHGLKKAIFNGLYGKVKGFNHLKSRWEVEIYESPDGRQFGLFKAENLEVVNPEHHQVNIDEMIGYVNSSSNFLEAMSNMISSPLLQFKSRHEVYECLTKFSCKVKLSDDRLLKAIFMAGKKLNGLERFHIAKYTFEFCLESAKSSTFDHTKTSLEAICDALAQTCANIEEFEDALKYNHLALENAVDDNNKATYLSRIGHANMHLQNFKSSALFLDEALDMINNIPYEGEHFQIYKIYCDFLIKIGQAKEGLKFLKALAKVTDDTSCKMTIYADIGSTEFIIGNFAESQRALLVALNLSSQVKNTPEKFQEILQTLVWVCSMNNEFDKVKQYVGQLKTILGNSEDYVCVKLEYMCMKRDNEVVKKFWESQNGEYKKQIGVSRGLKLKAREVKWMRRAVSKNRECAICHTKNVQLFECAACGEYYYCGKSHQKIYWKKEHRKKCTRALLCKTVKS